MKLYRILIDTVLRARSTESLDYVFLKKTENNLNAKVLVAIQLDKNK